MNTRRPYRPPAVLHSQSIERAAGSGMQQFDFDTAGFYIRAVQAVAVALSHALRPTDTGFALMIYPAKARLSWHQLPAWAQDKFTNICSDLGLTDEQYESVRRIMFRNTPNGTA